MSRQKKQAEETYSLTGPRGLNLAEHVLVGTPNRSKFPQRRPLVLSYEELNVFSFSNGNIGRELERTIELLSLRPKERARRLAILKGIRNKIDQL